jgi:hypothetical protein
MKHRMVRRTLAVLAALALTSMLFACGGGSSSSTPSTGSGATLSGSAQ